MGLQLSGRISFEHIRFGAFSVYLGSGNILELHVPSVRALTSMWWQLSHSHHGKTLIRRLPDNFQVHICLRERKLYRVRASSWWFRRITQSQR